MCMQNFHSSNLPYKRGVKWIRGTGRVADTYSFSSSYTTRECSSWKDSPFSREGEVRSETSYCDRIRFAGQVDDPANTRSVGVVVMKYSEYGIITFSEVYLKKTANTLV